MKKMGGRQNKTKWRLALPNIEPRCWEYYFFKRYLAFMQNEQKKYALCIWSNFVYASLLFDNVLVCWCCSIAEISLPSFSIKLSMRQICMHATTLLNIMILRSAFWNLRYFRVQCGGNQRMSHKRSPKTNIDCHITILEKVILRISVCIQFQISSTFSKRLRWILSH